MAANDQGVPGATGISKSLENVRKIRKRFQRGQDFVIIPCNDDGHKLLGTLALVYNYDAMRVMLEHYGVSKRVTIQPLENEAGFQK